MACFLWVSGVDHILHRVVLIGAIVAPLYISEISPPEIRGALLVLEEFSIVTGIVVAFVSIV